MIDWVELTPQGRRYTRGTLEVFVGDEDDSDPDYLTVDPNWYWRAKGKNGQKSAQSEGYTRRGDAVRACTDHHSARFINPLAIRKTVVPWRLVVFNRDGSIAREGLVY
jgi:hypothetical protein